MKVRELLKDFNGKIRVRIYDQHDFSTHDFATHEQAILNYGHFTVRNWGIEEDGLMFINIRSQF